MRRLDGRGRALVRCVVVAAVVALPRSCPPGASSRLAHASSPADSTPSLRVDDERWPAWPTALDDVPVILSNVESPPEVGVAALERLKHAPEQLAGPWVAQALTHPARAVVRAAAHLCVDRGWTRCIGPAIRALDTATDLRTQAALYRVLTLDVDARAAARLESALRGSNMDAVVAAALIAAKPSRHRCC